MTFSGMLKQTVKHDEKSGKPKSPYYVLLYCKRNTQHVYTTGRKPSAFPVSSGGGITPSECIAGFRPSCQRKERPALVEIPRSRCSLRMLFSCCASSFRFIMSGGLEEGSGSHEPRSCLNSLIIKLQVYEWLEIKHTDSKVFIASSRARMGWSIRHCSKVLAIDVAPPSTAAACALSWKLEIQK